MAKMLQDQIVPWNTGASFIVKKGQRIRVIAESTVDFVVFNADNLYERFDQARTILPHAGAGKEKIYISTGDGLYSKLLNRMMTIVEDTYKGHHDLQHGLCCRFRKDDQWARRDEPAIKALFEKHGVTKRDDLSYHGCWENLSNVLQNYPILPLDIPSPLGLFTSVEVGPDGRMIDRRDRDRPEPGKPAHVDLKAEMNCLVALSACPEHVMGGKAVRVQVFDE